MTVDVLYEGLTIATAAAARAEGDALFVELESPMPVGSALVIRSTEGERAARVERVREGSPGAGIVVRFGENEKKKSEKPATGTDREKDAAKKSEPVVEAEPEPDNKGRKRKNTRKTVLGH